jgi:glycine C-acetyltransferase
VLNTTQGVTVGIQGGQDNVLNFCANNYLGLSSHPEVVEAGVAALRSHGAGVSSVRFICGTQDIHKDLEGKIAKVRSSQI